MTYLSTEPLSTESWDDICYPVRSVWLADLLPDHDIVATDRQQLVVGQMAGGRKTLYGIQSADYTIIPNEAIREVVEDLISDYQLLIKYTLTGEFNISIVLPATLPVGNEILHRSLIITNSYNGKTPFSIQGQSLTSLLEPTTQLGSSVYRNICQNGLLGWADPFADLDDYRRWLQQEQEGSRKRTAKNVTSQERTRPFAVDIRKLHHSTLTVEKVQQHLRELLIEHLAEQPTLTSTVYNHFQEEASSPSSEGLLRSLPIPAQMAKQARDRLRFEERLLESGPSYWLLYNAVNYTLFTARSSLTLNDRYRLDERVFHQLAAQALG